jgi:hypothetical protein
LTARYCLPELDEGNIGSGVVTPDDRAAYGFKVAFRLGESVGASGLRRVGRSRLRLVDPAGRLNGRDTEGVGYLFHGRFLSLGIFIIATIDDVLENLRALSSDTPASP